MESKYKNLVIIGNGFDRWQGLPSSYEKFREYYLAHVDEIMRDLGIARYAVINDAGEEELYTAVDLIYGDPLNPGSAPDSFFWSFEESLDKIDDQKILMYFGRSKAGLENMRKMIAEARTVLRTAFSNWILSIPIEERSASFRFPKDCFFINFNYTDTLQKRFGIAEKDIYYIHGNAREPETILFGHASHPETAFRELVEQELIKPADMHTLQPVDPRIGLPRLEGLYYIEDALYQTDKHTLDNIDLMCKAMFERGVRIEEIENIYVLGHSFGSIDMDYFAYLDKITRCGCDFDGMSAAAQIDPIFLLCEDEELGEALLLEGILLNLQYAAHHRNRVFGDIESLYPDLDQLDQDRGLTYSEDDAKYAVKQRFYFEQADRTQKLLENICQTCGWSDVPEGCYSVLGLADYLDGGHMPRKRNAKWHISYFSPEDKKRIEKTMKTFRQKRYALHNSIDACIAALNC